MESSSLDENELLSSFMWAAGDPGADRTAAYNEEASRQSWFAGMSMDLGPPQLSSDGPSSLHSDEVRECAWHVYVRACVRACACACACVCVRAYVLACICICVCARACFACLQLRHRLPLLLPSLQQVPSLDGLRNAFFSAYKRPFTCVLSLSLSLSFVCAAGREVRPGRESGHAAHGRCAAARRRCPTGSSPAVRLGQRQGRRLGQRRSRRRRRRRQQHHLRTAARGQGADSLPQASRRTQRRRLRLQQHTLFRLRRRPRLDRRR